MYEVTTPDGARVFKSYSEAMTYAAQQRWKFRPVEVRDTVAGQTLLEIR